MAKERRRATANRNLRVIILPLQMMVIPWSLYFPPKA
jgi:hypothetical protein